MLLNGLLHAKINPGDKFSLLGIQLHNINANTAIRRSL